MGVYPLVSLVSLYLLINSVLRWGSCPLAYPFQKGAQTLLPRAPLRSYRERSGVHTESVSALLPRAHRRSYRERFWGGCVRAPALSEKGGSTGGVARAGDRACIS